MRDLCTENFKTSLKEISGKRTHVHGLEDLKLTLEINYGSVVISAAFFI